MASNEQFINIEQEYEKNSNLKREDMIILRQFVETKYPATSDLLLFLFLHSCYYDIETAKITIDSYYKLRSNWPEVFKNINPSGPPRRKHLPITVTWPLKQYTNDGYRIFYSTLMNYDYTQYDLDEQIKLFFMVFDYWFNILGNADGIVVILDAKGLSWGHIPKFGITAARKLLEYVQEASPIRLKAVHYIHTGAILEKILVIVRMFMKQELHDLTHVHSDFDSLYKYVPKSCLPKDYGGDDVTIKELHENMMHTFVKNSELFEDEDTPQVAETIKKEKFSYLDVF